MSDTLRPRQVIEIEDDDGDDMQEIPAPIPERMPARLSSRLQSLFVTPGPDEPRTTGTPDTWRSTSAMLARRASSAPHVEASSPRIRDSSQYIDLTNDSDEEGEDRNSGEHGVDKGGSVQPKEETTTGADKADDGRLSAQFTSGTKRARLTSPASEGGGEPKRQKPSEPRTGSHPLLEQSWAFPKEA